jgi:hypothetical protein
MDQQRGWSACLLPTDADPQAQTSSLTGACEVIVILRQTIQRFRWSEALLWAWEDLNLRPHPERRIARVINGLCRTKESRAWPGMPRFSSIVAATGHGGLIS